MKTLKVSVVLFSLFLFPINSKGSIHVQEAAPTCSLAKQVLDLIPQEREEVLKKQSDDIAKNTLIVYELAGLETLEQITNKWAKENHCFINA